VDTPVEAIEYLGNTGSGGEPAYLDEVRRKQPVILAVDDDALVLAAISRDLMAEFSPAYRVLRARSGAEALDRIRALRAGGESVALLVVDQRMPRMTGIQFLREAIDLVPDVKRVLLTAYADTEAAIRAINEVRLDHYLLKPWSPPEEYLYPVLRQLLEDWRAGFQPPFEGIQLIGHRWSAEGHVLRDFLSRNMVPYHWTEVESSEAVRLMESAGVMDADLPIAILPDGSHLVNPSRLALAGRIGLQTEAEHETYDLAIVGAGPSGLAAAVYGASEGLKTILVERDVPGGQAGWSANIENYLGFPAGLSGRDLARRAVAQARRFGAEILSPVQAVGLGERNGYQLLQLSNGTELRARAVLVATGVSYRMLEVPGAEGLTGAGIYYGAAISEALAASDQDVFVLGGGNSAGQAAIYLSRFARSVTLLVRDGSLVQSMSRYLITQIERTENIRLRTGMEVVEVHGKTHLEQLSLLDLSTGAAARVPAHALFVFIGAVARTEWLGDHIARDASGYLLTGPDLHGDGPRPAGWTLGRNPLWLETNKPGVFVAGDVRWRSVKRVASAVGEGAMAVQFVHQHLGGGLLRPRPRITVRASSRPPPRTVDRAPDPIPAVSGSPS
jgi:thioredoxin reductase (NADPH)